MTYTRSRDAKRKGPANAQNEAAGNAEHKEPDVPVIVELKKDETFDSDVFISMFSGQIYDVLVASDLVASEEDTRATEAYPLLRCRQVLESFAQFLPQLASVTAKKQGRRRFEQIEVVTDKSDDLPLWAQPDFGFKLAGAAGRGEPGGWMLPGTYVPGDDKRHSSRFHPGPEFRREWGNLVPRAVSVGLEQPAARALATGNPWHFTISRRELVLMRFYRIDPSVRWLPAVHPGQVRVGVSYVALPVLPWAPEDAGASSLSSSPSAAWQHWELFALPWYRDASAAQSGLLSHHLGLWVALMARLCAPDEEVGTGPPPVLNSWHRRYASEEGWVHEAHYSTAVRRAPVEMKVDDRRYPVLTARKKARYSQHDRECEAMARHMGWRPDSPAEEEEGEEEERPREKTKCRLILAGTCAQVFHGDDRPWIIDGVESSVDEQGREEAGSEDD